MSRATVRSSVATYFAPPKVTGLNTVFTSMPKRAIGSDFRKNVTPGTLSTAIGVVHLDSESEARIAYGGEFSGKKMVRYQVSLDVYSFSLEPHAEDAMTFFDSVIDGIKTSLRNDRRLGNYPIIFEAGEGSLNGVYGEPALQQDGSVSIWGRVVFEVSEVLTT